MMLAVTSCQSVKNALSGVREENSDEFLIQKKNPLVLPPDFTDLPDQTGESTLIIIQEVEGLDVGDDLKIKDDYYRVTTAGTISNDITGYGTGIILTTDTGNGSFIKLEASQIVSPTFVSERL